MAISAAAAWSRAAERGWPDADRRRRHVAVGEPRGPRRSRRPPSAARWRRPTARSRAIDERRRRAGRRTAEELVGVGDDGALVPAELAARGGGAGPSCVRRAPAAARRARGSGRGAGRAPSPSPARAGRLAPSARSARAQGRQRLRHPSALADHARAGTAARHGEELDEVAAPRRSERGDRAGDDGVGGGGSADRRRAPAGDGRSARPPSSAWPPVDAIDLGSRVASRSSSRRRSGGEASDQLGHVVGRSARRGGLGTWSPVLPSSARSRHATPGRCPPAGSVKTHRAVAGGPARRRHGRRPPALSSRPVRRRR